MVLNTIGPWELALIFVMLLIIFGPRRLVDLARGLGEAIREFREGLEGGKEGRSDKEDKSGG